MKVKIKDLKPNPFKKEINKGELNKEQVKKIKSNIKELGLMGSLPVFKRKNQYYLICGHHRLQAMKEVYGSNYAKQVPVVEAKRLILSQQSRMIDAISLTN